MSSPNQAPPSNLLGAQQIGGGPNDPAPQARHPPGLDIQQIIAIQRDYQNYCEALTNTCPDQPPMEFAQYAAFQTVAAQLRPAPTAIEPNLEMHAEIVEMRRELEELKRKSNSTDDADYAGDAEDDPTAHQAKKKRRRKRSDKKQSDKYLLSKKKIEELTQAQLETREQLQEMIRDEVYLRTGYHKNYFPVREKIEDPMAPLQPPHPAEPLPRYWRLDFDVPVNVNPNAKVVRRAAEVVFGSQDPTSETCKLKHPNVRFTEHDCKEFAKTVIRSIVSAYRTHMDPEEKGKKRLQSHAHNRRSGRQRQLKSNRLAVAEEYQRLYGVDPTPLLETDWMSEELSDWNDAKPDLRTKRRNAALKMANLPVPPPGGKSDAVVLEVRRPRWRSKQYNKVIRGLDEIRASKMRKRRKRPAHPRIELSRPCTGPPSTRCTVFSMMISQHWEAKYAPRYSTDELPPHCDDNPPGFDDDYSTDSAESTYDLELATPLLTDEESDT
ncbi:hypothetical protein OBBRIDRAFT_838363 [Obba rivulosa]|uniref:Uncharacterized protein n=1 Tax=Obba rivulosa TaxID=1052685 RepID=A0A8E2AQN0_9APHY|nr:hypothetical protein OBBRIDRAFT_838363 [Obba rivulosa]